MSWDNAQKNTGILICAFIQGRRIFSFFQTVGAETGLECWFDWFLGFSVLKRKLAMFQSHTSWHQRNLGGLWSWCTLFPSCPLDITASPSIFFVSFHIICFLYIFRRIFLRVCGFNILQTNKLKAIRAWIIKFKRFYIS